MCALAFACRFSVAMAVFSSSAALGGGPARGAVDETIGGAFQLVDQHGKSVTDRTYHGKPALLYFGFMSCPDICPTDLARMARIARSVRGMGGPELTPIFVTVDPERDRPASLKPYLASFGATFVGLTGSVQQVASVAARYHVYYRKVPGTAPGTYTMDHSTFMFLLDREGRYVDHFGRGVDENEVARRVLLALADQDRPDAPPAAAPRQARGR